MGTNLFIGVVLKIPLALAIFLLVWIYPVQSTKTMYKSINNDVISSNIVKAITISILLRFSMKWLYTRMFFVRMCECREQQETFLSNQFPFSAKQSSPSSYLLLNDVESGTRDKKQ